jgi:hypothetical protein
MICQFGYFTKLGGKKKLKKPPFLPSTDLVWCLHTTLVPRHPVTLAQIILLLQMLQFIYFLNLIFSQIFEWENEESFGIFRVHMHLKVALNYGFFLIN